MNQGIAAVMAKYGLTSRDLRSDGRLTLAIDGTYRVHLIASNNGGMVIESRIRAMPEAPHEAERCMEESLRLAVSRMRDSACTLALDREQRSLMLQQQVPASASAREVEDLLGKFVNELAWWRKVA
ncbi:CesT family type III secretion system chaperone [Noviherbaspirillum sp. CPCC 100848]|uniref:CesT family type III secretion system chaperone n=1 Tax=Noviherbaspirillum album TaxID=3080276 RepID=A0ABU6JBT5_9BURK|nr:CesT family type III secretion system chaperone [Noviherbaspirillum sp. CPCC 100848]MEC4720717.1 CesT family type III secretion system chaperone [Noviherbaspirillum sp. CPCC 100848]